MRETERGEGDRAMERQRQDHRKTTETERQIRTDRERERQMDRERYRE